MSTLTLIVLLLLILMLTSMAIWSCAVSGLWQRHVARLPPPLELPPTPPKAPSPRLAKRYVAVLHPAHEMTLGVVMTPKG